MSRPLTALEQAQRQRNKQLCEYVRNTAQVPLAVHDFDDDWTPAGSMYRESLTEAGLIEVREPAPPEEGGDGEPGGLYLTEAGEALANE